MYKAWLLFGIICKSRQGFGVWGLGTDSQWPPQLIFALSLSFFFFPPQLNAVPTCPFTTPFNRSPLQTFPVLTQPICSEVSGPGHVTRPYGGTLSAEPLFTLSDRETSPPGSILNSNKRGIVTIPHVSPKAWTPQGISETLWSPGSAANSLTVWGTRHLKAKAENIYARSLSLNRMCQSWAGGNMGAIMFPPEPWVHVCQGHRGHSDQRKHSVLYGRLSQGSRQHKGPTADPRGVFIHITDCLHQ